jgi:hypothetical protein
MPYSRYAPGASTGFGSRMAKRERPHEEQSRPEDFILLPVHCLVVYNSWAATQHAA